MGLDSSGLYSKLVFLFYMAVISLSSVHMSGGSLCLYSFCISVSAVQHKDYFIWNRFG